MDLLVIGQPKIDGVKVNERPLAEAQTKRHDTRAFRLLQSEDTLIQRGIQIILTDIDDVESTNEVTTKVTLHPLSRSRRRRAKKRGWARFQISTTGTASEYGFGAYLLFASSRSSSGAAAEHQPGEQNGATVVLYYKPDTASFLGRMPDEILIADLSLPGTHDTCAFYGVPISQCQQPSTPLSQQLLDGVRYIDIRCQVIRGELIIYHGARSQRKTFVAILADLRSFLESHPTETVIMAIKDEKRHEDFSRLVWLDMEKYRDVWYLENRVPLLGEVRGKAVVMGRFWTSPDDDNWVDGQGWRIPGWGPPVQDLAFDCGGTRGILQDWYDISSFLAIPEKFAIITRLLQDPRQSDQSPRLTISYASASGYPLAPPFVIAKGFGWPEWGFGIEGINSRLEGWLVRQLADGKRIRGIIPLDFYRQTGSDDDGAICELLVLMNML